MHTPSLPRELWTPTETAAVLGLSPRTLATWRSTGRHALPYVKVGRLVRYRAQDVAAWLQARTGPQQSKLPENCRAHSYKCSPYNSGLVRSSIRASILKGVRHD